MRNTGDLRPLVLLVTRNFPPLMGGMEKVNSHLLDALQPDFAAALCGPTGSGEFVSTSVIVRQSRVKPLAFFLIGTLWRTLVLAWRTRPQWVLAGSGLTAPIAWLAARTSGAKAGVYLHGLDIVAPSRVYQWFWLPFIRRCDMALVNSANTARLGEERGLRHQNMRMLHPGTDMPTLDPNAASIFRDRLGIAERPLLLSVGRLTQRKGLVEFVERSLPMILAKQPDTLLVVIGDEASDALRTRAGSERERILAIARYEGIESSVRFLGRCDEATLSAAYQAANLHIFPVLDLVDDVEGFGMVALESAAHGLPTVGFAVGGVPDAVQHGRTGTLVESGNYAALSEAVIDQIEQAKSPTGIATCRAFASDKAWPVFGNRLRNFLSSSHG